MHKRWINFYRVGSDGAEPIKVVAGNEQDPVAGSVAWISRELADEYAMPGRVACVEVAFDDGTGLP